MGSARLLLLLQENFDPSVTPMPASLPKSRGFAALKSRAEKLLGGEVAADIDSAATQQVCKQWTRDPGRPLKSSAARPLGCAQAATLR